jgi:protein required for attachment to host cells
MQATWVLVADRVRARLFFLDDDDNSLVELEDFINIDGRKPRRAFSHDRPASTLESVGSARHAIEPHTSAIEKVETHFAKELSEALEQGRVGHQYQNLILAAPPHFLGALRQSLSKQVRNCVVAEVHKDLSKLAAPDIQSCLEAQLALCVKKSRVARSAS